MKTPRYIQVAVPVPLQGLFDYRLPQGSRIEPGTRVEVPFGRRRLVGLAMGTRDTSALADTQIRPIQRVIDASPLLPGNILQLIRWAADYYHHPVGEVFAAAVPRLIRQGNSASAEGETLWQAAPGASADSLARAPRQAALLQFLLARNGPCQSQQLRDWSENWRQAMKALEQKGLVQRIQRPCLEASEPDALPDIHLNAEQQAAVDQVAAAFHEYGCFLLQGITGSGKTEVYLALVNQLLAQGRQILILVPEISLTPQLIQRFRQRLRCTIAALHSGLNDNQRLCAWTLASLGKAQVVIGTRSALFTPMPELGLIIIDEEHDASFKQQEGFRYHARDLALVRARNAGIPVLMGSATPSLDSLYNVQQQRYRKLVLSQRGHSAASPPAIHLIDLRNRRLEHGMSDTLLQQIDKHLGDGGQVLVFLNRRGYAPLLMCHSCGWTSHCPRCDAHMTLHQQQQRLRCHHCGHESPVPEQCPDCGAASLLVPGAGTERLEQSLSQHFPDVILSRIDRDTTRRKGELDRRLKQARTGEARILIGTQMLAKGHDFPQLSMVALVDIDQGLFSSDFRGPERMAQLVVQVAGRAGRADKAGEVFIQTHHPDHPLLQTLLHQGYDAFARAALQERQQAGFPPGAYMAILRAEASQRKPCMDFLSEASRLAGGPRDVGVYGPLPAPMERRAGRYRAQLILQAARRGPLHQLIKPWLAGLEQLPSARSVRWSLDIDPQDVY